MLRSRSAILPVLVLAACGFAQADDQDEHANGKGGTLLHPKDEGRVNNDASRSSGANGILYHGGPVMLGTVNLHYIFYGNWSNDTATSILPDWGAHIGGTPYFNIETTYFNGAGTHISNSVSYAGAVFDNYSKGKNISDSDVVSIVANSNPSDPNGVYFVLTSADVNETSGFCTVYCGFHNHATINGQDIKYVFAGNAARCPSACSAQTITPNGNLGADAMVNIMSHELDEAVTDPDLNAWFDRRGNENGDKCNFNFGPTSTLPSGAHYNQTFGTRNYLIQQNWVNANGGLCAQRYP